MVAVNGALAVERLPEASNARTVYVYAVLAARPVSAKERPVGLPTNVVPRSTS